MQRPQLPLYTASCGVTHSRLDFFSRQCTPLYTAFVCSGTQLSHRSAAQGGDGASGGLTWHAGKKRCAKIITSAARLSVLAHNHL